MTRRGSSSARSPRSCCARGVGIRTSSAVLVLEVTRSGHLAGEMDEIVASFAAIQEIVERGQADGSIRADLDARLASYVFYGAIDELLTGWVLGRLPDSDDDIARAERTVVEIVTSGLAPEHAGTPA